jgi:S1-C subfamily serine protease
MKLPIGQIEKSANIIKLQEVLKRRKLLFFLMLFSVFLVIGLMEMFFSDYTKPLHANSITAPVAYVVTGTKTGTAFLSGPSTLLTARHVIDEKALGDELDIIFMKADIRIDTKARLIWKDNSNPLEAVTDFAVLRIINPSDLPEDMPIMTLGNSDDINIGDKVKAIGYPAGLFSVTEGRISNTILEESEGELDLMQLDCNIFPGNSGGPIILSETEEVIGLAESGLIGKFQGINFASKINLLKEKLEADGIDIFK